MSEPSLTYSSAITSNLLGLMVEQVVHEGAVAGRVRSLSISHVALCNCAIDDVRVWRWDVVKNGFVDTEVLGKYALGRVREPIVNVEGCSEELVSMRASFTENEFLPSSVEVTLVEDK